MSYENAWWKNCSGGESTLRDTGLQSEGEPLRQRNKMARAEEAFCVKKGMAEAEEEMLRSESRREEALHSRGPGWRGQTQRRGEKEVRGRWARTDQARWATQRN